MEEKDKIPFSRDGKTTTLARTNMGQSGPAVKIVMNRK